MPCGELIWTIRGGSGAGATMRTATARMAWWRPGGSEAPVVLLATRPSGPRWRQTSPGLYVPADVDGAVVEQRVLEQGMRLVRHGAVTGWAALRWRGAQYFSGL